MSNNGFPWKQRPKGRINRGLGLVSDKKMMFAKYSNGCLWKQRPQQELIGVSVWVRTKQCRLQ